MICETCGGSRLLIMGLEQTPIPCRDCHCGQQSKETERNEPISKGEEF